MSAPQRIGAYPIERELGRGGMGIVYLGRDARLDRAVAIKVLPEAFAGDAERVARFEREARLLASLHHPNIAGIYGLEEADGRRLLALEYVEGPTLAERLARGPLPPADCIDVARQIAAALEAAHEAGVIHRDLKPGNVKITPAGDVKVLDFGLAKAAGASDSALDASVSPTLPYGSTVAGVILGTAAYMSPEQARGRPVDRRTDIWSFGCVLYEMLTGRQAFGGETVSDTIAKILEREPDWSAIPAATPEKIRELLRRCLEKDARRRLRDIGDARIELEDAAAARGSKGGTQATGSRPATGLSPGWARFVAVGSLVVALLALLQSWLQKEEKPAMRLSVNEPEGARLNNDAVDCALSPDGRTVVFSAADSAGTVQLWARPLDALGGRPIPGTENGTMPFWSPDSRSIAFFADGKLKKARIDGGVETVCDARSGRGGSWSRNGTIAFTPSGEGPIFAVSESGGEPRQVTTLDSTRHESSHRFPCLLPDGKHFLYVVLPAGARGFQVKVGSLDGGRTADLMTADSAPVYAESGWLVFMRDRSLVARRFDAGSLRLKGDPVVLPDSPARSQTTGMRAATVSTNGALAYMKGSITNNRLTWYDRTGRALGTVPIAAAAYGGPVLSADDRTVAVVRGMGPNESDILLVDLARGVATRLTYGPRLNTFCRWSHDGSRIAFESNRNGPFDIYLKTAGGAEPEPPLVVGRSQFKHPSSWSPDDRLLAFYELEATTGFDIWLVPTDGSGPPVPYLQTPSQESDPVISPDGRWMLYTCDESGRPELYVQSFPVPGHRYQVTTGGCLIGVWRADGREILGFGQDVQSILSADVLESGPTFRAGVPRTLFRVPPGTAGFAVTHDGQRFLMPVPEARTTGPSITVALNWQSGLKTPGAER